MASRTGFQLAAVLVFLAGTTLKPSLGWTQDASTPAQDKSAPQTPNHSPAAPDASSTTPLAKAPAPGQTVSPSPAGGEATGKKEAKKADTPAKQEKKEEHEPADPDTGTSTLSAETLGLLPNPYEKQGIKFTLSYVGDLLSNVDGGLRRGTVYEGRLNGAIDLDFAKLAGISGLLFHANAFQIHGPALSRDYIGNLLPVSSIEAQATTRLYEAWFEQKFWNDKFSIRAGQLAADAEFITSQYTDPFISGTFGWPAITAINLPSGGPSPPLAAMGARVKAVINDNFTVLAAVFDGNAAGPGTDLPQSRDRYGVNFRVNDPPETLVAATYLAEIRKGWNVIPTFQYVIHPGGGYVLDNGAARSVKNASVFGVRTVIKF